MDHHDLAQLTADLPLLDQPAQQPAQSLVYGSRRPARLAYPFEQVDYQQRRLNFEQRAGL